MTVSSIRATATPEESAMSARCARRAGEASDAGSETTRIPAPSRKAAPALAVTTPNAAKSAATAQKRRHGSP